MKNDIDKFAEMLRDYTPLEKAGDLLRQLQNNYTQVMTISENIKKAESDNTSPEILQHLYMNEFHLLMDNVGLYEDINLNLDRTERTASNEFELARIRKTAPKFCLVGGLDIEDDEY